MRGVLPKKSGDESPHSKVPSNGRRRRFATVRAIGLRGIVWGGLICAVLVYSGNLRWPMWRSAPSEPAEQTPEPETPAGPAWPHLRGPAYSGVSEETGLADRWPTGGPTLVWKREIGRGYSGVTAAGNRLFTQRQTPTEQSVLCLDAETGQVCWTHDTRGPIWASCMVADGKVYVGTQQGDFWILAAGREKKVLCSVGLEGAISGTATIANGVVYVATMKRLYAFRKSEK